MRHFIGYHSEEGMRQSSTKITSPKVKTGNNVDGLAGVTVWLIAGEGRSPKDYYIAAQFVADKCETDKFPGTKLSNQISGVGTLYKLTKPISGSSLLDDIKTETNNFRNGFHELTSAKLISDLVAAV